MIYPIILSGGQGKRLWPLSTSDTPKQFIKLLSSKSPIQLITELVIDSQIFSPPTYITTTGYAHMVREEIENYTTDYHLVLEPGAKGTAAAVYSSIHFLQSLDPNSIFLTLPSDLCIQNHLELINLLKHLNNNKEEILDRGIILFGITPTNPQTGFGYMKLEESSSHLRKVQEFIEKPAFSEAAKYINNGYLWNSGILLCSTEYIAHAAEKLDKETWFQTKQAFLKASISGASLELDREIYSKITVNSFDYAILEKTDRKYACQVNIAWHDLGSWESLYNYSKKDVNGNVLSENVLAIDTKNSHIISYNNTRTIATLNLEGITIINTMDSTLIMPSRDAQDLKKVVSKFEEASSRKSFIHSDENLNWGMEEIISSDPNMTIHKITLKPNSKINFKKHSACLKLVMLEGNANLLYKGVTKNINPKEISLVEADYVFELNNPNKHKAIILKICTEKTLLIPDSKKIAGSSA